MATLASELQVKRFHCTLSVSQVPSGWNAFILTSGLDKLPAFLSGRGELSSAQRQQQQQATEEGALLAGGTHEARGKDLLQWGLKCTTRPSPAPGRWAAFFQPPHFRLCLRFYKLCALALAVNACVHTDRHTQRPISCGFLLTNGPLGLCYFPTPIDIDTVGDVNRAPVRRNETAIPNKYRIMCVCYMKKLQRWDVDAR